MAEERDGKRARPFVEEEVKELQVPSNKVGLIIGKRGETIRSLQAKTGCRIQTPSRQDQQQHGGGSTSTTITFSGGNVEEAIMLVNKIVYPDQATFEEIKLEVTKKLYVDILNFASSHFFVDPNDWSILPALDRVQSFVEVARNSGIELCIFIDAVRTEEALDKWHDRMTKAVIQGKRNVPQNISGIMGEMCFRAGCEVRYSTEINNDDTLASHAAHDHAAILSGDKDFLRYVNADKSPSNLVIYSNFQVNDNRLLLQKREYIELEGKRTLLTTPPTYHRHDVDENIWVHELKHHKCFRGGAPTPLVRALGFNPYITMRPLRMCLYRELLIKSADGEKVDPISIREEFPIWDELLNSVQFPVEILALPEKDDLKLLELSVNPKLAFEFFFPRESNQRTPPKDSISSNDWYRHCHGCKVIIIEVCCYFPANKTLSFLDTLIASEKW